MIYALIELKLAKWGGGKEGGGVFSSSILSWWESEYFCLFGRVVGAEEGVEFGH